jgi:hypothetical protein
MLVSSVKFLVCQEISVLLKFIYFEHLLQMYQYRYWYECTVTWEGGGGTRKVMAGPWFFGYGSNNNFMQVHFLCSAEKRL